MRCSKCYGMLFVLRDEREKSLCVYYQWVYGICRRQVYSHYALNTTCDIQTFYTTSRVCCRYFCIEYGNIVYTIFTPISQLRKWLKGAPVVCLIRNHKSIKLVQFMFQVCSFGLVATLCTQFFLFNEMMWCVHCIHNCISSCWVYYINCTMFQSKFECIVHYISLLAFLINFLFQQRDCNSPNKCILSEWSVVGLGFSCCQLNFVNRDRV